MNIEVNNLNALSSVAQALLTFAGPERIFIFKGDMGAGKTTFIKVLCQELGVEEVVTSPTFSLVNEYVAGSQTIYHFDFYRIKDIREAYDIGYEEYFYSGDFCLVEWPERIAELLPNQYVTVSITTAENGNRKFSFDKTS